MNTPFELTEEQRAVLGHQIPGHGRVLAGPGTGKSATAVALAERLLSESEGSVRVKFLTFTRAATAELAQKVSESSAPIPHPATFHSFAVSAVLRNRGCASFPWPLRIPDSFEYHELIRPHLARMVGVPQKKLDKLVQEMAAKWESLVPHEEPSVTPEERSRFLGWLDQHRRVFGYTLVQELPDLMRCALRDHDDLEGLDYDALIVDEYQDLNACELEVLDRLRARGVSVVAVGDDDQSIYTFRMAHPEGIRRFPEEFKPASEYELTLCHRSAQRIVDWGQFVIGGDTSRLPRPTLKARPDAPEGIVKLLGFQSDVGEARGVAKLVQWLVTSRGVPPSRILIVSRTNDKDAFSKPIKEELQSTGIGFVDADVVRHLLAQPPARKALALLRLAANPGDSLAWWSLVDRTPGLGTAFLAAIYDAAVQANRTFGEQMHFAGAKGFGFLASATRSRAMELFSSVVDLSGRLAAEVSGAHGGWGRWILSYSENGLLPELPAEFGSLLLELDEVADDTLTLDQYLSQIEPAGKDLVLAKSAGVRFMTMVGCKGLTVQATIIIGAENDLIPRPDTDPQEERRLLYVAMTRAEEYLFVTWAAKRQGPTAWAGRPNQGRRQPTDLLRGGPVQSQSGEAFLSQLTPER